MGVTGSVLMPGMMCVIEGWTGGKGRCRRDDRGPRVSHDHQQPAYSAQHVSPHGGSEPIAARSGGSRGNFNSKGRAAAFRCPQTIPGTVSTGSLTRGDEPPMFLPGMAAALKRLLTLGLMLALVIGTTAQLVPVSMAQSDMGVSANLADGCAGPKPPCTGRMPNCLDHICCVTVSALPASLASVGMPFEWTSLYYPLAPESLSGISVKPELSPPILAA
jgi:hypothetical protein